MAPFAAHQYTSKYIHIHGDIQTNTVYWRRRQEQDDVRNGGRSPDKDFMLTATAGVQNTM
jgi:hypothetical protein